MMRLFIDDQEISIEDFCMWLKALADEEAELSARKLDRMVRDWRDAESNTRPV